MLIVMAALPAILQIGIAAWHRDQVELVSHDGYFGYLRQRGRAVLSRSRRPILSGVTSGPNADPLLLARSRPQRLHHGQARRHDHALFLLNFVPQTLLFFGNAVATETVSNYITDNATDFLPILASSLAISFVMGAVSLAIASQSSRRLSRQLRCSASS